MQHLPSFPSPPNKSRVRTPPPRLARGPRGRGAPPPSAADRSGGGEPGEREAPGRPPPRRPAHLFPALPPASRWGYSSSSPAWCLLPALDLGLAPPRLRGWPRLPARLPGPAAARSGLFTGAGAPRRLPDASRRRRAPRARLKLAGGYGWRRPGRAGQKGLRLRCGREAGPGAGGACRPKARTAEPPGGGCGRRE